MPIEKHLLSKSSYIRSLQCLKSLYLYKYHYKLRDPLPPELKIRFEKGHDIGKLAQQLFPGGVDCSPPAPWDYRKSVEKTRQLIESCQHTIYEAAFQYEQVLAAADILLNRAGKWFVYEVKSSLKVSDTYLHDAALQYFLISNSGIQIEDFLILHLNRNLDEAITASPSEIFTETSVKDYCLYQSETVAKNIFSAKTVIEQKVIPDIAVGEQCLKPYKCDFYGYCH